MSSLLPRLRAFQPPLPCLDDAQHQKQNGKSSEEYSYDSHNEHGRRMSLKVRPELNMLPAKLEELPIDSRECHQPLQPQIRMRPHPRKTRPLEKQSNKENLEPDGNKSRVSLILGLNALEIEVSETARPKSCNINTNKDVLLSGEAPEASLRPSISTSQAILSWSPKKEVSETTSEATSFGTSKLTIESSEASQGASSAQGIPSPGTFGVPSPSPQSPGSSLRLSSPLFHSTPKLRASKKLGHSPVRLEVPVDVPISMHSSLLPFVSSGLEGPHLQSECQRVNSTLSGVNGTGERQYSRARFNNLSSQSSQRHHRRRSAEWNAHAASAGVIADPSKSAEFGWPAEVSREILRLSLGSLAAAPKVYAYDVSMSPDIDSRRNRRESITKIGEPRVSHESKNTNSSGQMRSKDKKQHLPSAFLHQQPSLPIPRPVSNDGHGFLVTQHASNPRAPNVALRKSSKTRSRQVIDKALDTKADDQKGVRSSTSPIRHRRSGSANNVDWSSTKLQDYIEDVDKELSSWRPSTPIKQSASHSSYETAGSSSFLHAPSLSVIAATPQSSRSRSRRQSGANSEFDSDGLRIPPVPALPEQSEKSKGKRKADDTEEGILPEKRTSKTKKTTFAAEGKRPHRDSNASFAPSSFQSFQSTKSRKRVRLSSPASVQEQLHTTTQNNTTSSRNSSGRSVISNSPFHPNSSKASLSRPHSRTSMGRVSRTTRPLSTSGASTGTGVNPGRRSLSQSSIPLSAILSPRAPSVDAISMFHMRDPQKPVARRVGWTLRFASQDDDGSPYAAWAFWFGFLIPILWWIGSFWRIPETRMVGTDTEKAVIVDDPFVEREARAWRSRCRIASCVFFITYLPVIVLLAVLVPQS